jgi:hypothetical protein
VDKSGSFRVDLVAPVFNRGYNYYEQPDYGWRVIAKIFVKNNDIIYCSWDTSEKDSTVTVAPLGYTGEADYYCTGTADDIFINAAILYIQTAITGGTVKLRGGSFYLSNWVEIHSNIRITGDGFGTVINGLGYGISSDASSSSHHSNIQISDMKLGNAWIYVDYTDGIVIENIFSNCEAPEIISLTSCTNVRISKIIGDGAGFSPVAGNGLIYGMGVSNSVISECSFSNITQTGAPAGFYFHTSGNVIISNNTITGISTSTGVQEAQGIFLYNLSYSKVSGNRIEQIQNTSTATNAVGIRVNGGSSNKITDNYCYNNGSDVGIANDNSNNFADLSTDTQVYSNSWQSPVASEPAVGEMHFTAYGIRASDWMVSVDSLATGVWSASTTMVGVPVGAKAGWCACYIYDTGNSPIVTFEKASGITLASVGTNYQYRKYNHLRAATAAYFTAMNLIPIDANGEFKYANYYPSSTIRIGNPVGYTS